MFKLSMLLALVCCGCGYLEDHPEIEKDAVEIGEEAAKDVIEDVEKPAAIPGK